MKSNTIIFFSIVLIALTCISVLTWGNETKINNVVLTNTNPATLEISALEGKAFTYTSYHPYYIGFDLDNALATAISKMDEGYDLLVNSTVNVQSYYLIVYFSKYFTVQGTAYKSTTLRQQMGEKGYQDWLLASNVIHISGDKPSVASK